MPRFPELNRCIALLGSRVYSTLADRARDCGGPIYPLHLGDTFTEPAQGCRMEDLSVAELPGLHRYAPVAGLPQLRQAIAVRYSRETTSTIDAEQVLVTAGATGGLAACVAARRAHAPPPAPPTPLCAAPQVLSFSLVMRIQIAYQRCTAAHGRSNLWPNDPV